MRGRIFFEGNPWPEGHQIKEFVWSARTIEDATWYDFHLETMDYNAERDPQEADDAPDVGDWVALAAWNNFHACILSSTYWEGDATGFRAGDSTRLKAAHGVSCDYRVDQAGDYDWDCPAFNIYLLGHDAVASHDIRIAPSHARGLFDIDWTGKIALAYVGEDRFDYRFRGRIEAVKPPEILV